MKTPTFWWLALLLLTPSVSGCGAHVSSHRCEVGFAPTSSIQSPSTDELRLIAERSGAEGSSVDELRRALAAIEELERVEGESVDLIIWKARVVQYMVESLDDTDDILRWCRRGERLAERIRELAPDRVEGYYFGGLFLGMRAQHQRVRAAMWLSDLEAFGRRAVESDETYDDAGPLRFLGMFLVSAPAWPLGPGDTEEGVELLEHAVEVNDYPLNRMLLARGLVENGDDHGACQALREAFSAPAEGRWAITGPRWRPEAERLATQISCQLRTPPGIAAR